MGVPLFKGEEAFDIFDRAVDGIIAVSERQLGGEDNEVYGAATYIGQGEHRYCLQDAEPALLGDIRNRVRDLIDEGLTREKLYETFVDALPGLSLPNQDSQEIQRVASNLERHFHAFIAGERDTTLTETERDGMRTIFNVTSDSMQARKYDLDPQVIAWVGQVYTKLDRAFSETWQSAWTQAHSGVEGAPRVEDVSGLETRFVPPGASPGG